MWLFNRSFSLGRLYLGSIIGIVLGVAVFFLVATLMGQDPYTLGWTGMDAGGQHVGRLGGSLYDGRQGRRQLGAHDSLHTGR